MGKLIPLGTEHTSVQLALKLFEELADENRSIAEAQSEVGFKRNRLFLDISELGLVASRALDAIHFLVAQDKEIREVYDIDLDFFKWMMSFSSNNHKHLKKALKEAQRATLEGDASSETFEKWGSKTLLTSVVIYGGRLVCQVDPVLQKLIKDPERSYFYSLRISNAFSSIYAHRLYARLLAHLEQGGTDYEDLETIREWMGCNTKFYKNFGEFNRGVIKVAVSQVNEFSNLKVTAHTRNTPGSKTVGKMKFTIEQKPNWQPKQESLAWSQELYEILVVEIGLSQDDLDRIRTNRESWTDERLQQAIEYTRHMADRGTVKSVPRYFMRALEEQWRVPGLELKVAQQQLLDGQKHQAAKEAMRNNLIRAAADEAQKAQMESKLGLEAYSAMDTDTQTQTFSAFSRTPMAATAAKAAGLDLAVTSKEQAMANTVFAQSIGNYIFHKLKNEMAPSRRASVSQLQPKNAA